MRKVITVFCPVYNEEENVEAFHEKIGTVIAPLRDRYDFRFLFADNRSTDDTVEKLREMCAYDPNVSLIRYSRNFGVMKSIYTGMITVRTDAVAVFDCDLQDPPELLLDFVKAWEGGAKIVYGRRVTRDEPRIITFLRRGFRKIERFLQKDRIEIESGAWFLDKRILDELRRRNRFEPYIAGMLSRLGFKTVAIPYDRRKRERGTSKFNFLSYFSYATDGIVSGTVVPLRLSILFGVLISGLSFLAMIYFLMAKFLFGASFAAGVAASIIINLFGLGANLIFLGIIGEYVGRIYLEKDGSEPAIIDEAINLPQAMTDPVHAPADIATPAVSPASAPIPADVETMA
jgi:dolichol-phosphate mannosyltransferase